MVLNPTYPVDPETNIRIFPDPSETIILHESVSNPEPVAEPIITLDVPVVILQPELFPIPILFELVFCDKANFPIAVLFIPVLLNNKVPSPIPVLPLPVVLKSSA